MSESFTCQSGNCNRASSLSGRRSIDCSLFRSEWRQKPSHVLLSTIYAATKRATRNGSIPSPLTKVFDSLEAISDNRDFPRVGDFVATVASTEGLSRVLSSITSKEEVNNWKHRRPFRLSLRGRAPGTDPCELPRQTQQRS